MSITISSPITGSTQTGFTSSSFTVASDSAPDSGNGKQVAVTAVSGTGTSGVTPHTASSPFTGTVTRPKSLKTLGTPNPTTGVIGNIPTNTYKVLTRKGVKPAANQPSKVFNISTTMDLPSGSDTYDPDNVRAAIALHIGLLTQISAGLGDTLVTNIL